MPLWFYLPRQPEARLTATEKEKLHRGLVTSAGGAGLRENEEHEAKEEHDD